MTRHGPVSDPAWRTQPQFALRRSIGMGAPYRQSNGVNMGALVAVDTLPQYMKKLIQYQQRHPQCGVQPQAHKPPMLALEDLSPDARGMTTHGPVIDPALQQQTRGQE